MISSRSKVLVICLLFVLTLPASALSLHRTTPTPATTKRFPTILEAMEASKGLPETEIPPEAPLVPRSRQQATSRGADRPVQPVTALVGTFNVSAYTADDDTMNGEGITATGKPVQDWYTVAVDPRIIALGTTLYIPYFKDAPNHGIFVAHDTGGVIKGYKLDVYMSSLSKALAFGRRDLEVYVIK